MRLLDKIRVLLNRATAPMKPGEWRHVGWGEWIVRRRGTIAQVLDAAVRRFEFYSHIHAELVAPGCWRIRVGFIGEAYADL
jgi:hypothetical protein